MGDRNIDGDEQDSSLDFRHKSLNQGCGWKAVVYMKTQFLLSSFNQIRDDSQVASPRRLHDNDVRIARPEMESEQQSGVFADPTFQ